MKPIKALIAIPKGFHYCLRDPEIRKLAFWPWAIGACSYLLSLVASYFLHPTIVHYFISDPSGWWSNFLYGLVWFLAALVLLVCSVIVSIVFVMVLSGVFQTDIAKVVLKRLDMPLPEEALGVTGSIGEAGRTIAVESGKLLWLLPFMILVLIAGFIPLLAPFAFVLSAWMLAYQFIDVVLDIFKLGVRKRFSFTWQHALTSIVFGAGLTICCFVPFLGLFLPPVAAAGAAWLLKDTGILEDFLEAHQATPKPPTS